MRDALGVFWTRPNDRMVMSHMNSNSRSQLELQLELQDTNRREYEHQTVFDTHLHILATRCVVG